MQPQDSRENAGEVPVAASAGRPPAGGPLSAQKRRPTASGGRRARKRGPTRFGWRPDQLARYLLREWVLPVLPVVLGLVTFRCAVADWNDVPSGSMEPTILIGDRILVNKLAFGLRVPFTTTWLAQWAQPQRGDIVVLFSPADGTTLVKRVVGLPGDVVEMRHERLILNGQPVDLAGPTDSNARATGATGAVELRERLGQHEHSIFVEPALPARRTFGPIHVPPGHFLVLGDNRDRSADSRFFGLVPRQRIVGHSSRVLLSLNHDQWYLPRLARTLKALP